MDIAGHESWKRLFQWMGIIAGYIQVSMVPRQIQSWFPDTSGEYLTMEYLNLSAGLIRSQIAHRGARKATPIHSYKVELPYLGNGWHWLNTHI